MVEPTLILEWMEKIGVLKAHFSFDTIPAYMNWEQGTPYGIYRWIWRTSFVIWFLCRIS